MSRKPKRKMSQKEIKAPDEFQTSMAKAIEFLKVNGAWVGGGLGLVVLAVVAGVLLSRYQDASAVDDANDFYGAFQPVASAIAGAALKRRTKGQ